MIPEKCPWAQIVHEASSAALKARPRWLSLNYSTAAQTPAGCHSHRSPAGGAGRACPHGDPVPWPSHSPGSVWDRGSLPPH